jgi:hypothetical protein
MTGAQSFLVHLHGVRRSRVSKVSGEELPDLDLPAEKGLVLRRRTSAPMGGGERWVKKRLIQGLNKRGDMSAPDAIVQGEGFAVLDR